MWEWNTLVEETVGSKKKRSAGVNRSKPVPLTQISTTERPRFSTGTELDRVLGGGLVPGCLGYVATRYW